MFGEIDDEAFTPFIRIPLKGQAIPLKGYLSFEGKPICRLEMHKDTELLRLTGPVPDSIRSARAPVKFIST
jgi:hypothetical protein